MVARQTGFAAATIMDIVVSRGTAMNDVTQILSQIESGDPTASEQLLPLVYDELRRLAAQRLAHEKPGQTLEATALVHEAYLRLVDGAGELHWNSRGHFFAAAAEAMRRILVDNARRKKSAKGGGRFDRVDLNDEHRVYPTRNIDLIALDEALDKLAEIEPRKAELIKLRYFAGLSVCQAAKLLGISDSTAGADWAYAKSWLKVQMGD
jgi:RNA polymerase sigma factor (TIGR02999 family)